MSLPALSPFSPLASVLADVDRCIEAKLYYPALVVALTVPDICSALALEKSVFVKEVHYAAFVDKYTTPSTLGLDGAGCFRLRGGVVHRANAAGHPYFKASHVIFTIPETGSSMHAFSIGGQSSDGTEKTAAMLDLVRFCRTMVAAAYRWYEDHHNDPKVAKNMDNLIRYLPNGLDPFFGRKPVVASGP